MKCCKHSCDVVWPYTMCGRSRCPYKIVSWIDSKNVFMNTDEAQFELHNVHTLFPHVRHMYLNGAPHHRHARLTVTGVDKFKHLQLLSIRNLGWFILRISSDKCIFIENVNMGELFNGSQVEFNSSLQRVEISNTPKLLSTLPVWIGNCSRLEYLTIENSSLSSLAHINGATQLLHAKLSMNNFMNLSTQLNLPNLQTLDLSKNNMKYIDKTAFANLPSLNTLDLSDNILTKLHPVRIFQRELHPRNSTTQYSPFFSHPIQSLPSHPYSSLCAGHILQSTFITLTVFASSTLGNNRCRAFIIIECTHAHLVRRCTTLVHTTVCVYRWASFRICIVFNHKVSSGTTRLHSIDLRNMNLTSIPEAVTQPCQLQQLWMDFNHLFGIF